MQPSLRLTEMISLSKSIRGVNRYFVENISPELSRDPHRSISGPFTFLEYQNYMGKNWSRWACIQELHWARAQSAMYGGRSMCPMFHLIASLLALYSFWGGFRWFERYSNCQDAKNRTKRQRFIWRTCWLPLVASESRKRFLNDALNFFVHCIRILLLDSKLASVQITLSQVGLSCVVHHFPTLSRIRVNLLGQSARSWTDFQVAELAGGSSGWICTFLQACVCKKLCWSHLE